MAVDVAKQHEERLRAIVESKQDTPEARIQALVDLAHLAGILLHKVAEAESEIHADSPPEGSPATRFTGGSCSSSDK